MSDNKLMKQMISQALYDIADGIESGNMCKSVKVGITTLGSEHGVDNIVKGAERAYREGVKNIVLIGPKVDTHLQVVEANSDEEAHKKMEELLDSGEIHACVTMHYSFPIGVSTVGKVTTPAMGKNMFIATTTGTAATSRTQAMIKNAIYGIIAAKATGIENPSVGILNVDNARGVERALRQLEQNGYPINIGESARADGGAVMRGNDLLMGTVDVMVTDSLTGNLLMKMFSSYSTGGSYEASGYGYGPGIGFDYNRNILILSRASGIPVVANALQYAVSLASGELNKVVQKEHEAVKDAGLDKILASLDAKASASVNSQEEVKAPAKEVVTGAISGIDIMDLEDAVKALWKQSIYAESGMGCTGPIIMVSEANQSKATEILAKAGYVAGEGSVC